MKTGKRRALGQHYLVDPAVVRLVIQTCEIRPGERVLEIGTGLGVLTEELCRVASEVEAFEIDDANFLATKRRVGGSLNLHAGDAFLANPSFDVLVSSLPYSESSNFVEWLSQRTYERAIVLLQRDFVGKLTSRPHDARYRAISVVSQIASTIQIVSAVRRDSFEPPPMVSSVLVVIRPRLTLTTRQIHLIRNLFSQKRRRLKGVVGRLGLDGRRIPQDLLIKNVWDLRVDEIEHVIRLIHESAPANDMNE